MLKVNKNKSHIYLMKRYMPTLDLTLGWTSYNKSTATPFMALHNERDVSKNSVVC